MCQWKSSRLRITAGAHELRGRGYETHNTAHTMFQTTRTNSKTAITRPRSTSALYVDSASPTFFRLVSQRYIGPGRHNCFTHLSPCPMRHTSQGYRRRSTQVPSFYVRRFETPSSTIFRARGCVQCFHLQETSGEQRMIVHKMFLLFSEDHMSKLDLNTDSHFHTLRTTNPDLNQRC